MSEKSSGSIQWINVPLSMEDVEILKDITGKVFSSMPFSTVTTIKLQSYKVVEKDGYYQAMLFATVDKHTVGLSATANTALGALACLMYKLQVKLDGELELKEDASLNGRQPFG